MFQGNDLGKLVLRRWSIPSRVTKFKPLEASERDPFVARWAPTGVKDQSTFIGAWRSTSKATLSRPAGCMTVRWAISARSGGVCTKPTSSTPRPRSTTKRGGSTWRRRPASRRICGSARSSATHSARPSPWRARDATRYIRATWSARAAFDQALSVSREVRSPATIILALRGQGLLAHY